MTATDMMNDFPPSPDRQVTLANWRTAPFNRWSFRNVRRLVPTANIPASGRSVRSKAASRISARPNSKDWAAS